ncbi:MAG: cell division protein FtsZ [Bacilli bacterium]|nr:cell division protein FtsZ [Bacilli bacterium]
MFDENNVNEYIAKIKVIGIGGAGNNAVNRMMDEEIEAVEFIVTNTDAQALLTSRVPKRFTLGEQITKGLGAGAMPEIGRQAAEASIDQIRLELAGADMVFIAAGMGGGTGTGAAPVVARVCKEMGCLTIGIVTRPFTFEGKVRNGNAVEGLQALRPHVDSLIVVSNDQLLQMSGNVPVNDAFKEADNVLAHSVKTITDLIVRPARINLDFADVRNIMSNKGTALIGMGVGNGINKVKEAAYSAVTCPLLESSIRGAKNAIVSIRGGDTITILDTNEIVEIVREAAGGSEMNVIFGLDVDPALGDSVEVTVIATDFIENDIHRVDRQDGSIDSIDALKKIDAKDFIVSAKVEPQIKHMESRIAESEDANLDNDDLLPAFLRKRNR